MEDIKAYIFISYYAPHLEMSEERQVQYLNDKQVLPVAVGMHELRLMRDAQPSTKYLCHAFKNEGFSVGWIASHLKIPQPNVSYHLKTKPKQEWVHPTWQAIRLHQLRNMRQL
jgi:hypothetical protein